VTDKEHPAEELGELVWTWTLRIAAVALLLYLMIVPGFERAPSWAFILDIGLFFGPEAIRGQIKINNRNGEK
jgi:hypothetical protein